MGNIIVMDVAAHQVADIQRAMPAVVDGVVGDDAVRGTNDIIAAVRADPSAIVARVVHVVDQIVRDDIVCAEQHHAAPRAVGHETVLQDIGCSRHNDARIRHARAPADQLRKMRRVIDIQRIK